MHPDEDLILAAISSFGIIGLKILRTLKALGATAPSAFSF
jgi:hypothetical protein